MSTQASTADNVAAPPIPMLADPWSVRGASAETDSAMIADWMGMPHVERFWHQAWTPQRWRTEITGQLAATHSRPCVACHEGTELAYIEIYRVARDALAGYIAHEPHDLGVHIAIGDHGRTGRGLGRALLAALGEGLLRADPACERIVAEPDSANTASLRAFRVAGFTHGPEVTLPDKTAVIMTYQRRSTR